jgi:L-ascorbate metabolism protein UlaG (beta-lactamase superfamily)
MWNMQLREETTGVRRLWEWNLVPGTLGLAWLGQAGFALRSPDCRMFIDPYLSDSLGEKYRGTEFPHNRIMAIPIRADELNDLDWVLCSHKHSDHMDPGTLPLLARNNPKCQFVVPRAEQTAARAAGVAHQRMAAINAGDTVSLCGNKTVTAIASAHERLKVNEYGQHHFLGFIVKTTSWTIYHSGDCIPYEGLAAQLRPHQIDAALLPVNGRDSYRSSRGIPGNMTFSEACQLCIDAHIPYLIPHHFGMFEFNTIDTGELKQAACKRNLGVSCLIPDPEHFFILQSKPCNILTSRL